MMIANFLKKQLDPSKPLLLALSGGTDSKALLLLLLDYKKNVSFPLHIAHIDHGWREESYSESMGLQKLALSLNIPFHLKVLKELPKNNLEDFCRDKRYEFFEELQKKHAFQAVILGHHQDDLAETILKRIFEGASFNKVSAMDFVTSRGILTLWRPLLNVSKKTLSEFLASRKESFFDDYTNKDNKYLRARFRQILLPFISKTFGKEISRPLVSLAKDLKEVHEYLESSTETKWKSVLEGPFGLALNFKDIHFDILIKHLLRKMADSKGIVLKRSVQNFVIDSLKQNKSNCKLEFKDHSWIVDRDFVFLVVHVASLENWKIDKTPIIYGNHWTDAWQGRVTIPIKKFDLKKGKAGEIFLNKTSLDKWWQSHKVPAFLRSSIPVVYHEDKPVFELLSGVNPQKQVGVELESVNLIYITRY